MEHLKGLSQVNRSSNGIAEAIDLTLRLGLPYYDPQNPIKIQVATPMKQETINVVVASNEAIEAESSTTFSGSQSPPSPFVGILSGGIMRKCKACGNEKSPVWRKGPDGPQTLCNACGLRYARLLKKQNIS